MSFQAVVNELFALRSSLLLASLAFSYVIATVIHRLYFHPLSKFPGPFWARISAWPAYWHTLKRDRHVWLWCLQEEYGKALYHPRE